MRDLGNLVFLAVIVLGWVIKVLAERRQGGAAGGSAGGATPRRLGAARAGDAADEEVDLIVGRRPLPEHLAPPPVPAGLSRAGYEPSLPGESLHEGVAAASGDSTFAQGLMGVAPASDLHAPARLRRGGWRRLGLRPTTASRSTVRAGVLWREILGPPRAHTGPHRPPGLRARR